RNSRTWVDESGSGNVQALHIYLCLQRSRRRIVGINRAAGTLEFKSASARKVGAQRERKLCGEREILHCDIDVLVHTRLGGSAGIAYRNHAVFNAQFSHREILLERLIGTGFSRWR